MKNETRCYELGVKFLQMGESLLAEGNKDDEYNITQSGTIMILLSSLMMSDRDMFIFSELASMFVAKKILDENAVSTPIGEEILASLLAEIKAENGKKIPLPIPKKKKGGKKPDSDKPDIQ